ncbi:MAG: hypothetical protein JW857_06160 [Bacteroidales bacterium]|nr:hypothetical protein [Bacteroidales bacterium]
MIQWFIQHQWKQATRSSIWQKNIALNIVIGFFMTIMLLYLLLLGVMLDKLLEDVVKDANADITLSKILIYYFIFTFLMRFFLQSLPAMEIVPYLHLRIKRSTIGWFMLFKSLTSFFNFIPFLLFLPFALGYMTEEFSGFQAFIWFSAIFLFELTSNFKLIYFKRKFTLNPKIILLLIGAIALLVALDKFDLFSISDISLWYFTQLNANWMWILLPLFTTVFFVFWNLSMIRKNSYLDDLSPKKKEGENLTAKLNLLQNFGKTGELVLGEIKLIIRNKRSKSIVFLIPFFLLYGLFFYPQDMYKDSMGMLIFVGIFVTGGFLIAYGQYLMAWESSHFDFILSSNIGIHDYFKAKYFLLVIPTMILYFFTIPYMYFGMKIFWVNVATLFYNLGVNAPLLLYMASFNKKRMDLSGSSMMNYQGVGVNNFIMVLPLLAVPALLYWVVSLIFGHTIAILFIGALGLFGLLFNQSLIRLAVNNFIKRRYQIAEGYRQKG